MGEVYAAKHIKLGKRVAIKVISRELSNDDTAIERFSTEAKTLAQIQHPAIVAVDHVGELTDGRAFFSMELLRGESLFARLQRGRIPLPEALRILDQMARGLDAAHGEGVTHRDLKPENTFLVHLPGELPAVKLLDFGLAKLRREDDLRAERTQSGVAIGTPMYMSPEQARGPNVDHRTDIYALGCVAYELLLGGPPFPSARSTPELYAAHLHESPPLPRSIWPEIPPPLDLVLFAMLAKDPAHRPTLEQFRAVVATVRDEPSQRAITEFVGPRAARTRSRSLLIAAVALVGGITIGVSLTKKHGDPSHGASAATITPSTAANTPTPTTPISSIHETPTPQTTPPTASPTKLDPKPAPRIPRPRRDDGTSWLVVPRSPTTGSAAAVPIAAIVDAGIAVERVEEPPPTPEKIGARPQSAPIDRNQTVNPFAKKHKVSP